LVIGAVVALIFGATTAFALQQPAAITVSVDLNTEGNSGTAVGTIDTCRSVNQGDTFQIDIVVQGVPPAATGGSSGGIAGFSYNFHYDPKVLTVTAADNSLMLGSTLFEFIEANYLAGGSANPLPATSGDMRVDVGDLSGIPKSGDGVLSRLTIQAVGPGQSTITLDDEVGKNSETTLLQPGGVPYDPTSVNQQNALVTVGQPCSSAPTLFVPATAAPTANATSAGTPAPSPTITQAASPIPVGNTSLAVDAITTGNEAAKLGPIDDCASATLNETFQVDVVIKGVTNLLAWEVPITFDPTVLRVDDRNVKLFQAANAGSQVFDSSNQTPNDTGTYIASAFDTSDPPVLHSGDGILVRLKLTAIGSGTSQLSMAPISLNENGTLDKGVLLRAVSGAIIGDTNGNTFFGGPLTPAEIRVGSSCPNGGTVVPAQANSTGSLGNSSGGSSKTWIWIVAGVAAAVVVVAGGLAFLIRRRRGRGNVSP
jgi:Cohesin domain